MWTSKRSWKTMAINSWLRNFGRALGWVAYMLGATAAAGAQEQPVSLREIVTPSTIVLKDGRPVTFALHGFIEFKSLSELFPYIESQSQRWSGALSREERQRLALDLLRRGIESRVVSMIDERPLEALLTHTAHELQDAIRKVTEPAPAGYEEAFLAVQAKWKHSVIAGARRRTYRAECFPIGIQ